VLWDVFEFLRGMEFWKGEGRTKLRRSQAQEKPRSDTKYEVTHKVKIQTTFKSASLKPRDNTINENLRK